jgi:hypothetical protein
MAEIDQPASALLGVRQWHYDLGRDCLTSVWMHDEWWPGEDMVARGCVPNGAEVDEALVAASRDHDAPDEDCKCGLYAFYGLSRFTLRYPECFDGVVAGWGDTEMHDIGFRCKYMRIVALLSYASPYKPAIERMANLYGVPVIQPADIPLFALSENLTLQSAWETEERNEEWLT